MKDNNVVCGEIHSCKQEFAMHLIHCSYIKTTSKYDDSKEEKKNKHSTFLFLHRTESDDIVQGYYREK